MVCGPLVQSFSSFFTAIRRTSGQTSIYRERGRGSSVGSDKLKVRSKDAGKGENGETDVSERAIREQLARLLESSIFVHSLRLGRFLRLTVDTTLAGRADTLKEYLIGTEVYDRKPPYHPSADSIVRSEARRLRNKLKQYYESDGMDDPVFVYYRPGTYVPVFRLRSAQDANAPVVTIELNKSAHDGGAIPVAVLPFAVISRARGGLCGQCAQIIADELLHQLARRRGFRVCSACSVVPLLAMPLDLPAVARKLDVRIFFEGVVHGCGNRLRITARIVDASGVLIWSERFDAQTGTPSLFRVSEQIASEMIKRVPHDIRPSRLQKAEYWEEPGRIALRSGRNHKGQIEASGPPAP